MHLCTDWCNPHYCLTAALIKKQKNNKLQQNNLKAFQIIMLRTKLLKQWSRKTRSTVCSFTVSPASSPASKASITHLKKKGNWAGFFLNTFETEENRSGGQAHFQHAQPAPSRVSASKWLHDLLPKRGHFPGTSRWRCNRWTWGRHCWTLLQCNSPTSNSPDTGCDMQILTRVHYHGLC